MSDRYVAFANQVARIIGQKFPQVYIGLYAYGSTVAPPRRPGWKLEKNLMVEYANAAICFRHPMSDRSCEANRKVGDCLKGWAALGQPVVNYDYEPNPGRWGNLETPVCWYTGLAEYIRFTKKSGVYGWIGEGPMWNGSAFWFYLKANLLWDSKQDVQKLIADFCRHFYGPAGRTMEKYYRLLDSVSTRHAGHLSDSLQAFTPAVLAQADRLLEQAISEAADDDQRSLLRCRGACLLPSFENGLVGKVKPDRQGGLRPILRLR